MPVLSATSSLPMTGMAVGVAAWPLIPPTAATPNKTASTTATATPSTPTTPVDGRKKRHGLFEALKAKDRPGSSGGYQMGEISPLPPLTPKAAQLLGITVEGGHSEGPLPPPSHHLLSDSEYEYVGQIQTDGGEDGGQPRLRGAAGMQTKTKEECIEEIDTPVGAHGAGFFKKGNKKAMRMLDLLPSFNPRTKTAPLAPLMAPMQTTPMSNRSEHDEDVGYSSDSSIRRPQQRGTRKKKNQKTLQIMSPITETSLSQGGSILERDDPELDALYTAYADHRASYSTSSLPRSVTIPTFQPQYELEPDDLSDVEEDKEEQGPPEMVQRDAPIFGAVPNYSIHGRHPSPDTFQVRSPLQKVERRLLHAAEERMRQQPIKNKVQEMSEDGKRRLKLETRKSLIMTKEKTRLDDKVFRLKEDQKRMKKELRDMRARSIIQDEAIWITPATDSEPDDDSHLSICSSIDTDEEPEMCEARKAHWWEIPYKSVTPDMIKIIDVPLRKQNISAMPPKAPADQAKPVFAVCLGDSCQCGSGSSAKRIYSSKGDGQAGIPNEREKIVDSSMSAPVAFGHTHHKEQLEPFPAYIDNWDEREERVGRPKKINLPREESRLLVQNWVNQYGHTEERPMSTSFDPIVLAEREFPPAPLPKDGPVRTPKTRRPPPFMNGTPRSSPRIPAKNPLRTPLKTPSRPPKYHCVHVGHEFRPINLKKVPDNVAIGPLETRPFLHTSTGVKQHVHVPFPCEKCGKDCEEVIWECEIPACHMALCFGCAAEWQEDASRRNIDTWKDSVEEE